MKAFVYTKTKPTKLVEKIDDVEMVTKSKTDNEIHIYYKNPCANFFSLKAFSTKKYKTRIYQN